VKTDDSFRCPVCRRSAAEKSTDFPFCCERCRLVDLGKWFSGDYRIARPTLLFSEDSEDGELYLGDEDGD